MGRDQYSTDGFLIYHGDSLDILKSLSDNSVDAYVCDPPAGIGFMGRSWDVDKGGRESWIVWITQIFTEALRVLKPGAHAFVWALPRTSHWTGTAIENAGFEVRDVVTHVFGSGFPKNYNVAKGIDALLTRGSANWNEFRHLAGERRSGKLGYTKLQVEQDYRPEEYQSSGILDHSPETAAAEASRGFGTALKPANEHWILARKPISEASIAANVLKWGTGALNIDGCRVGPRDRTDYGLANAQRSHGSVYGVPSASADFDASLGRWPANFILTHSADCNGHCAHDCPVTQLDAQSGNSVSRVGQARSSIAPGLGYGMTHTGAEYNDAGDASRFFPTFRFDDEMDFGPFLYVAKASRSEREEGLDAFVARKVNDGRDTPIDNAYQRGETERKNTHPTVKPVALMRWLLRLITPPGGKVVDTFMGSGTTGVAAMLEDLDFIGMDGEAEYVDISTARISHAAAKRRKERETPIQVAMF